MKFEEEMDTENNEGASRQLVPSSAPESVTLPLYDVGNLLLRQKRVILGLYAGILLGCVIFCFFWPPTYEASISYMIKRGQAEPNLAADMYSAQALSRPTVTEDDLNSEMAIMQSPVVLERTVQDLHLESMPVHWTIRLLRAPLVSLQKIYNSYHHKPNTTEVESATEHLSKKLTITPQKKSAIIEMKVRWGDPKFARIILERLSGNYLAQHLMVNKSADTREFYQTQIDRKQAELADIEKRMEAVRPGATIGTIKLEKELAVRGEADFEAEWRKARASTQQMDARVHAHAAELSSVPERVVIEEKPVINQQALGALKSRVLELQLKRTELLQKYTPTNPLVKQAEEELSQAQSMLDQETNSSRQEQTIGINKVAETLREDYSLNRVTLKGDTALRDGMKREFNDYDRRVNKLNSQGLMIEDLERQKHVAEESLALYIKDLEQAEAQDKWNETRIVSVVPIAPAWVDSHPVKPNSTLAMKLALSLGLLLSIGFGFLVELVDDRFYSKRDVEAYLGVPVLAALDRYSAEELRPAVSSHESDTSSGPSVGIA